MHIFPSVPQAVRALLDAGILPPLTRKAVLTIEPDSLITLDLTVFVTGEQLSAISDALANDPQMAEAIARRIVFTDGTRKTQSLAIGAGTCPTKP